MLAADPYRSFAAHEVLFRCLPLGLQLIGQAIGTADCRNYT